MIRMNYILQSMNVLNGLLVSAIAIAIYFMMMPAPDLDTKSISPVKDVALALPEKPSVNAKLQAGDYALISDQNVFHPERKIPPEKKEEKEVARPEVILYGTLITRQDSIAFVENKRAPMTTPGRGVRQIALHKGDHLDGFMLTEITASSIVLTRGEERIIVHLQEGEKRKASGGSIPMGNFQPATPPPFSPAQEVAPPALPGQAARGNSVSRPTTRRGGLEEVKRRKAERPAATP